MKENTRRYPNENKKQDYYFVEEENTVYEVDRSCAERKVREKSSAMTKRKEPGAR
ncbi:MAG: hypothetical protein J6B85_01980 [Lachnospiraceae bacterium]|nr:hypothetical protein [Lachnospiraceae bacterium]